MRILHNARIFTLDPQQPVATALAIEQDRIVAVGNEADILALSRPGTTVQNLNGKVILPGFTDAHIHLQHLALNLRRVDCATATRAECLRRVAERAAQTPPGQWILGHGWNQNEWPEGFGSAQDLDVVAPEHPVFLTAKSLHAAWVNSVALRLAGIGPDTPDPAEGGFSAMRKVILPAFCLRPPWTSCSVVSPSRGWKRWLRPFERLNPFSGKWV